ncbi:class I SAM-dependent methyltransferase [Mucilaginibacter lappiensis]|uniref:class I SAM-dependent methyltransferase n=1 Tax=Mucilaginibacter lappiensis TaxID=354630 RepID=UPI003D1D78BC
MDFTILKSCVLCEKEQLQNIYKTHDRHYGIKGEFTIDKCGNCGLVFLNPMPSDKHLTSLYPKTYYSYQDFYEKDQSVIRRIFKKYIINIGTLDPVFSQPGKILDIGCGSGKFLYGMKKKGWQVYGVEVNENAAEVGNEVEQLNIHPGDLLSSKFDSDFFDYIRSNHSFEHITTPEPVLDEVHRILKKDGKLLIGVPNIESFNGRLFKKYWWYLGAPVHPFNYSVSTLCKMVEKHGFVVEKVSYNGDYAGVLGSLQIYLNRNNGKMSEEGFFIKNAFFRAVAHQIAKLLNLFKKGDAIEIICSKK